MHDLATQVRAYVDRIDEPFDPATLIEKAERGGAVSTHTGPSFRRRVAIAAAAAAVVVVAIAAAVLVWGGGPDETVAPTLSTLTPTPSTVAPAPETTVPPTTLGPDEAAIEKVSGEFFEWTRIRLPDGMEELTVAGFDGGLVVAGGNQVWMSPDGVNWAKTSTFPGNAEVRDIIPGGPGLVAVTAGSTGSGHPRIWTSTDGITWTEADLDGSHGGTLRAIADRGTDLVAVGNNLIATSSDGIAWTGTSLEDYPELGYNVWMHDVVVGGPGFVAVGGSEDGWSAAWTSQDGTTWSRQSFGPTSGSWTKIEMKAVTTGGPGFVAVGHGPPPGCPQWPDCDDADVFVGIRRAWVWTSPDGFNWTESPGNEAAFENSTMNDVTAYGDTLVAVGGVEGSGEGAVAWTSSDGITWQRLPHNDLFDSSGMSSVVAYRDGLIAAGDDSVWIATPHPSDE